MRGSVKLSWCATGQTLVGSLVVAVGKVRLQLPEELLPVVDWIAVDVLPLACAPEPLDEGVVGGPAAA